jgi:hypothetical protein
MQCSITLVIGKSWISAGNQESLNEMDRMSIANVFLIFTLRRPGLALPAAMWI